METFAFSPLVHILGIFLIIWFHFTANRIDKNGDHRRTNWMTTLGLISWVILCTGLAVQDFYFQNNAGFYPVVVFSLGSGVILGAAYMTMPSFKNLVDILMEKVPLKHTIMIHSLRIAAVGAIYKMMIGTLPIHFVASAGITDLMFGISAIYIAVWIDRFSNRFLIIWNMVGISIFTVALLVMQFSLPGILNVFAGAPTSQMVVSFPMVLVPTFVAPMHIAVHILSLMHILRSGERRTAACGKFVQLLNAV